MIKNIMKNKFLFIAFLIVILSFTNNSYASSIGITASNTLQIGGTCTVSISGSDVTGRFNVTSTNSGVISLNKSSVFIDNGLIMDGNLIATASSAGTATIKLIPVDVADSSTGKIDLTNTIGTKYVLITVSAPQQSAPAPTQTPTNTTQTPTNTATKSSNTNLSSLKVNQEGLSPAFNKSKTSYSLSVVEGVTTVKVTAIAENSGAKVSVSGNTNLVQGDNTITILVTAADGTKKTYKITVNKSSDPAKANAFLQNLIVENATLSPEFEKETLEYDCGTVASTIDKLSLLAFTENQQAKVEITGNDKLVAGENTIKVKVTAVDGKTTKEYTIKVTKEAATAQEVSIYPETNSLQNTNPSRFSNFIHGLWMYLKQFWLVLSLLFVCLLELAQIIYLYIKVEKFKKLDASNVENKDKLNVEEDKTLQTRRRNTEPEDVNNQSWRTDSKKEDSNDKTSDEKIDDISDELVDNTEDSKAGAEDDTDNFEDSIDTDDDK